MSNPAGQRRSNRLLAATGLAITALLGSTSTAALAAPAPDDLLISGSVVTAKASFDANNQINLASLSSMKQVGDAYVELLWIKPDLRDESDGTTPGPKKDDRIPIVIVGTAVADAKGAYTISATPNAEMLAAAAENGGWVNFMLATTSGADHVLEGVSRHWNGKTWTSFGDERPEQSPDRTYRTVFATDVKTGVKKFGTNTAAADRPRRTNVAPLSLSGCELLFSHHSYAHTVVMEFHNSQDSDGHWEYGGQADSTIDAAVKYDGTNWTIGGSLQVSNTAGSAIGGRTSAHYGKYIATNFRYRQGTLIHTSWWCNYNGDWAILPDRWEGGGISTPHDVSVYDCLDAPQSNYRDRYEIGQYFKKNTARAAKVGYAASIGGVSVGSTSGYSSRVDMDWTAVRNWIYICGGDAYPASAKIVYTY